MDSSRRRVLQLLGLSSLALTVKPVFNAFAKEEAQAEEAAAIVKSRPESPNGEAMGHGHRYAEI